MTEAFLSPHADKEDVFAAGKKFAMALYDSNCDCEKLDEIRANKYLHKIATQPVNACFQLASLPPTSDACAQHSLRVYLRVQEWLGHQLNPQSWGWKTVGNNFVPVATTLRCLLLPPDHLMLYLTSYLISCNCKNLCGNRSDCVRDGLKCSVLCGRCHGSSCYVAMHHMIVVNLDDKNC